MSSRRGSKTPQPVKRVSKVQKPLYMPRVMDHLHAKVVRTDEEYEASLSEAAKQTERILMAETERMEAAEAARKANSSHLSPYSASTSHLQASPGKRSRAPVDDDNDSDSDDGLVYLYTSPAKKQRPQPVPAKPVQKPAPKSVVKSSVKPTQKPAPKPVQKPSPKPARKPAQTKKATKQIRQPNHRLFSFAPRCEVYDSDDNKGYDDDDEEQKSADEHHSGYRDSSKSIIGDFEKLAATRKDRRYSYLFRH
ncbi:hypothetical protein F4778DRAFT_793620 [Xylariomycetidae sp. FL2044]|nr:hypothetical protein F4778DRAFT_793620 [Xylariomycetidae sp. FL2044]